MALGKGLSSLIPTKSNNTSNSGESQSVNSQQHQQEENVVLQVDVNNISPNSEQPRKTFEPNALKELSDSIKEKGILQPLVVIDLGSGKYELIAGERRLQASKLAGLNTVPVVIKKVKNEQEKLELALIENIQRHDLNPIEKAESFKKLQEEFHLTQEQVAKQLGKTRVGVANTMRLLELPEEIKKAVQEERVSEGHARSLLSVRDANQQKILFEAILRDKLSVRQTEEATKRVKVQSHQRSINVLDADTKDLENRLIESLGTKVLLKKTGKKGKIVIEFYSDEELKNIINRIHV